MSNSNHLIKLRLFPYSKNLIDIFKKQKGKLLGLCINCEVHHIGSTAIPGLGGKGIIDIMIASPDWKQKKEIIKKLKKLGFTHVYPKENGRIFISKPLATRYGGIHIHLVKKGNKAYKELLFFRDYLKNHKQEAKRYDSLKMLYLKKARGDRTMYNKIKGRYIKKIIGKLKQK